MRADVMRRVGGMWNDYQKFLNTEKIGEFTVRELVDSAPDEEAKQRVLAIACGTPPYNSLKCGFLAWDVLKGTKEYKVLEELGEMPGGEGNASLALRGACVEIGIDEDKCEQLETVLDDVCLGYCEVQPSRGGGKESKEKRPLTEWQRCVQQGMKGKEWDPSRIKELSKLYKEGKCPT